jgi:putative chitinase
MTILHKHLTLISKSEKLDEWVDAFNSILPQYQIDTKLRQTAFLAQCAHESGGFTILTENLNYSSDGLQKIFPKYFNNPASAIAYARQPEKIANRVYANRMGNGNEESGDGWKFRGRGLIQLTGKENYTKFSEATYNDKRLLADPAFLVTFEGAIRSACWFWNTRKLNELADASNLTEITKKINGGYHGLSDRLSKYNTLLEVFDIK